MRIPGYFLLFSMLLCLMITCVEDDHIDSEKPKIDLGLPETFPVNCDTLYFGESFALKVVFTDNIELGSFSIGIHHNFDHHSHSTEIAECSLNPKKDPVNPFTFIDDYAIQPGLKAFETNLPIAIPAGDGMGLFDEGDYHFFISLTDHEGWSVQKGLSIKILHR